MTRSKRRATRISSPIEEAESQRGAVRRVAAAQLARTVAGKGVGLVQAAREAIAPAFCGRCLKSRKGLTPVSSKSSTAGHPVRVTWLCVDCCEGGAR
jgi:hypothetical protein